VRAEVLLQAPRVRSSRGVHIHWHGEGEDWQVVPNMHAKKIKDSEPNDPTGGYRCPGLCPSHGRRVIAQVG
jgi:hypothetical protein